LTAAVPADTALANQKGRPIAATGPYEVSSYVAGERVLLTRNKNFRPWSDAAQPDGYADVIEWITLPEGNPSNNTAAVARGDSDWTDAGDAGSVTSLRNRFGDHVFVAPTLFTSGVELNTTIPPFNNRDVRRALSYAIDRRTVAAHWGGQAARITCQTLPPNFPAHQAYCPSRIRADNGGWNAPDRLTAMGLIRASRTSGMKVTVWSEAKWAAPAEDVVSVLRELGYDAHASLWGGSFYEFFPYVGDSRHRVQAALIGENFDPPVASGLPTTFSCASRRPADPSNANYGLYCDPRLDALMSTARAAQSTSPAAGNDAWAEVDRRITDDAAWIPLVNWSSVEVTSTRVHHYETSPVLGVLFAKLYLK
jgi:peptide/nickel transport system substrate-binding protein